MDNEKQSGKPARNSPSQNPAAEPTPNTEVDEFFRRLKHDMRWPKPSPEAMAAALQATQRLALEADSEESLNNTLAQMKISSSKLCSSCGHQNREQNRF